jgi:hypothetical protein
MDKNLVGYLLKSLESDEQREVESYLRNHPEAQRRLELLRQAIEPLAADKDADEPPAGLRLRTLARVAEYRCRELLPAPKAPPPRMIPGRSWWRRADVLVAASLLMVLLPMLWSALSYLH